MVEYIQANDLFLAFYSTVILIRLIASISRGFCPRYSKTALDIRIKRLENEVALLRERRSERSGSLSQ